MIACEPPTGEGHPPAWAMVASIVAVAAVPIPGRGPIACEPTPVNSAWVVSWESGMFRAGLAWESSRIPTFTTLAMPEASRRVGGSDRLSPRESQIVASTRSRRGRKNRSHSGPASPRCSTVFARSWKASAAGRPSSGWA